MNESQQRQIDCIVEKVRQVQEYLEEEQALKSELIDLKSRINNNNKDIALAKKDLKAIMPQRITYVNLEGKLLRVEADSETVFIVPVKVLNDQKTTI